MIDRFDHMRWPNISEGSGERITEMKMIETSCTQLPELRLRDCRSEKPGLGAKPLSTGHNPESITHESLVRLRHATCGCNFETSLSSPRH